MIEPKGDIPRNKFDQRHYNGRKDKQKDHLRNPVPDKRKIDRTQQKHCGTAETVDRQATPRQKAGIDQPFPLDRPERHLKQPARKRTEQKNKQITYEIIHKTLFGIGQNQTKPQIAAHPITHSTFYGQTPLRITILYTVSIK